MTPRDQGPKLPGLTDTSNPPPEGSVFTSRDTARTTPFSESWLNIDHFPGPPGPSAG